MKYYDGYLENLNQNDLILILLKQHSGIGSKGMTQEEIANALNISVDSIRSGISILRNKYMEAIVDYTFVNEETNFKKKRYKYTRSMQEFKNWRLKNRNRSEGQKLGRPMY
tara:strand:- start:25 stop:357 length:333 start_codon:yes stop_codon:yes gene_type:complete